MELELNQTRLLVSIRNANEASTAVAAGVDWIDLKEPDHGSLGMPTLETAHAVAQYLASAEATARSSVALGDIDELDLSKVSALARLFPVTKVGIANKPADWRARLDDLQSLVAPTSQLVPVHYADSDACGGATFPEILDWIRSSAESQCSLSSVPRLLIDTKVKDGRTLLDYYSQNQLTELQELARRQSTSLLLAGSLNTPSVLQLRQLGAEAIGVRGAVCETARTSSLCEIRLSKLVAQFKSLNTASTVVDAI